VFTKLSGKAQPGLSLNGLIETIQEVSPLGRLIIIGYRFTNVLVLRPLLRPDLVVDPVSVDCLSTVVEEVDVQRLRAGKGVRSIVSDNGLVSHCLIVVDYRRSLASLCPLGQAIDENNLTLFALPHFLDRVQLVFDSLTEQGLSFLLGLRFSLHHLNHLLKALNEVLVHVTFGHCGNCVACTGLRPLYRGLRVV